MLKKKCRMQLRFLPNCENCTTRKDLILEIIRFSESQQLTRNKYYYTVYSNFAGDCDLSAQNSEQAINFETLAENSSEAAEGTLNETLSFQCLLSEGESSQPFFQRLAMTEERKFLLQNKGATRPR